MSQENVELVRRGIRFAFNLRDRVCLVERTWETPIRISNGCRTGGLAGERDGPRGSEAVWDFAVRSNEPWEKGFSYELIELIDCGRDDVVAAPVWGRRVRGKASGIEGREFEYWAVLTFSNGETAPFANCSLTEPKPSKPPGCRSRPALISSSPPSPRPAGRRARVQDTTGAECEHQALLGSAAVKPAALAQLLASASTRAWAGRPVRIAEETSFTWSSVSGSRSIGGSFRLGEAGDGWMSPPPARPVLAGLA